MVFFVFFFFSFFFFFFCFFFFFFFSFLFFFGFFFCFFSFFTMYDLEIHLIVHVYIDVMVPCQKIVPRINSYTPFSRENINLHTCTPIHSYTHHWSYSYRAIFVCLSQPTAHAYLRHYHGSREYCGSYQLGRVSCLLASSVKKEEDRCLFYRNQKHSSLLF